MAQPTTAGGPQNRLGLLPSLGLAAGAVLMASAVSTILRPWVSDAPFALFHLAVLVSAAIGGGTAGGTAVALSLIAVWIIHLGPIGPGTLGSLLVSGLVAGAIVVLVVRLSAVLGAAVVRAEGADRIKSAFLATMSHELRTPLNSILGFTGILLQGLAGPLNSEQSKQLGMVRSSARHLLELINDVLDISKIEAGQLEVRSEAVDLGDVLERVVASVRPMADQKGLTLTTSWPGAVPPLRTDRRRLEQIALNLLQNAVKFTDRGGVTLTVLAGVAMADRRPGVQIRVSDSGIGIRAEDLGTLFQPFRQLDTGLSRQHEGTGLGLAICRRLTDLLGGELHAESTWGVGSTFVVTFPVDPGA